MNEIGQNIERIRSRIDQAAKRAGREGSAVQLIAVSKGHSADSIRKALQSAHTVLGESYVQEWQDKHEALQDVMPNWHFIGALQSNKIRYVVGNVDLIHGIDRKKLIKEVSKRAESPQKILIQVNIADEDTKSGCQPDAAAELVRCAYESENVVPCGLMTIPPNVEDEAVARRQFRSLRDLRARVIATLGETYDMNDFVHLSMGMSGDFEMAVEEGATMVRVGTAIFGERDYR